MNLGHTHTFNSHSSSDEDDFDDTLGQKYFIK